MVHIYTFAVQNYWQGKMQSFFPYLEDQQIDSNNYPALASRLCKRMSYKTQLQKLKAT